MSGLLETVLLIGIGLMLAPFVLWLLAVLVDSAWPLLVAVGAVAVVWLLH